MNSLDLQKWDIGSDFLLNFDDIYGDESLLAYSSPQPEDVATVHLGNGMEKPILIRTSDKKTTRRKDKGKTSAFRGVTRTSKSAWGAKYSSKRITSRCHTEEEAARAYDKYLQKFVPLKYAKYANFCPTCDQFTNSLRLSTVSSKCMCDKKNSKTTTTSPASDSTRSPTMSLREEVCMSEWTATDLSKMEPSYGKPPATPIYARHSLELVGSDLLSPCPLSFVHTPLSKHLFDDICITPSPFADPRSSYEAIYRDVSASCHTTGRIISTPPSSVFFAITSEFLP